MVQSHLKAVRFLLFQCFVFSGMILLSVVFVANARAALTLSKIINSGMVMQRDIDVPLWGTATPNDTVTVTINGQAYTAIVDATARWQVILPPMGAGGPFTLTIESAGTIKTLTDVYVGDVWLLSGQSNIEMALANARGGSEAIAAANDPTIRQFKVPKGLTNEPSEDLPAGSAWTPATSQYAANFSAIGYFFARDLRPEIGVPIGLLNVTYGGARIETFMSDAMLGFDESNVVLANGEPERQPTVAYNKMLHPILDFPIKGVVWYQGESNADNMEDALAYGALFKTMITGWRDLYGLGDFPFIWVQLPNYGTKYDEPQAWDAWPQLRANQSRALSLPNTGEVITIDVGSTDIHPTNKEPVGQRLAVVARKVAYGEDIVFSGPRYHSNLFREDGCIEINYDYIGSGLVAKDSANGAIRGFAVAGSDNKLVWAKAVIDGEKVLVWNDDVPEPLIVRYAWEYNPAPTNLYNVEGLPAAPLLADVNPGFKIAYFKAAREAIEYGQSTSLTWLVYGASSVALDGVPVDSTDTIVVSPTESTTYKLVAINRDNDAETDSASVTIDVLDPNMINRALNQPVTASTFEACCGDELVPELAVDGDFETRWSSAWQEASATTIADPNLDDNPDDEWIMVDLGDVVDIDRVILYWETAYGSSYDIELSYDGYLWRTMFEERNSDGGDDNITFDPAPSGRYLRMHGLERATQWGFSLWEIAAYGTLSTMLPPTVQVTTNVGNVFSTGATVVFVANTTDADGEVINAAFYVDGELLSTDDTAPFQASWMATNGGEFAVTVVVTDSDGHIVQSDPFMIYVDDGTMRRFEAENAMTTGQATKKSSAVTSGGYYMDLRDAWTMTFDGINMPAAGEYLLSIAYQLTYESPKTQYLVVNGDTLKEVEFTAPNKSSWLQKGLKIPLNAGNNEIAIHGFWNWMSFDYIAIQGANPAAVDEAVQNPKMLSLAQNYPNPFNPTTQIRYTIPHTGQVRLEVFDVTGKLVTTLVNGVKPAGISIVNFDANHMASGMYVYKLSFGSEILTKSMVLVR
ncbi:discoidin domain-containing protein [candidate division KSB1 bacterium]|nr:discoidin domain-containing protein [candidate division KSB1 bacterium]